MGKPTVQHEAGKADVIANGPGTARQVPEGNGWVMSQFQFARVEIGRVIPI